MFISLITKITGHDGKYSLIDTFFVGLCIVGAVICITSIFIPSDIKVLLALLIISAIYLAISAKGRRLFHRIINRLKILSKLQVLFILFIIAALSVFMLVAPQLPDSLYYHVQNIMWNEQYSVVPGLANLIEQMGFNSNNFLLYSVFGLRPIFGEYIYGINAISLAVLFFYIITSFRKEKVLFTILGVIVCMVFFWEYRMHIGSPSSDLLPNILVVYLFLTALADSKNITQKGILFVLLPVYCITLKLSTLFVCLFTIFLFIYFIREKRYKEITWYAILCLIVCVPWLARNAFVSGYLIYPFPSIDIFNFGWKVPLEYVIESRKYVEAYAISVDALHYGSDYVLNLSFGEQLKLWLRDNSILEIFIVVLAILSPLLYIIYYISGRKSANNMVLLFIWVVAFSGFLFGLLTAPAVRFSLAFILMAGFIPVYYVLQTKNLNYKIFRPVLLSGSIAVLLFIGAISVRYFLSIKDPEVSYTHIVYKPQGFDSTPLKEEQRMTKVEMNNFYINEPEFLPFDTELPSSRRYVENIEMRGRSLQEGFHVKTKNP
jgi:hypothetical protein